MVQIVKVGTDEQDLPIFKAYEAETGEEIPVKNWFEKSKNKWHIVLGPNSANRKYIAHNEFDSKAVANEDGELTYTVQDKTTGPRVMGTAQPDRWAIKYMTEEEKADYEAIIARAMERRAAEKAEATPKKSTMKEKLAAEQARYDALVEKLKAMGIEIPDEE